MDNILKGTTPLLERLRATSKPIVLYGMGNGADKIISIMADYGLAPAGVFASDGFVRGHCFHGFEVLSYTSAKERLGDMVVLLCFGTSRPDVMENIRYIASEQELYAPDVEVCGNGLFTPRDYQRQRDGFCIIHDRLADEQSQQTFRNILAFKLSGDIRLLDACATSPHDAYAAILALSPKDIFLDAGAYDGDSVREFSKIAGGFSKIYAIEPDAKSFSKLERNTAHCSNITYIHAAVHDTNGQVPFAMQAGRQSRLGSGQKIDAVTIDSIAPDATFIKMDVEGNELAAIHGGAHTIAANKPKLAIAAYHRHNDLLLPLEVLRIRHDYNIYMRHFHNYPAWDTVYCFT